MKLNKPYTNKEYADLAVYCNRNGMIIEDKGNYLESVLLPEQTEEEKKMVHIAELKQFLSDSDYWTSKYCDGEYTDEEWAEKVAQRKAWREEIRELEK